MCEGYTLKITIRKTGVQWSANISWYYEGESSVSYSGKFSSFESAEKFIKTAKSKLCPCC